MRIVSVIVLSMMLVAAVPRADADVLPAPRQLVPEQWAADGLTIGHVGHASVLLKMDGTLLLTDPTFFERIGVGIGLITLGPERIIAPALSLDRLPTPAAVIITHAHFDSLDLPSLEALPKESVLIAPPGCRDLLGDLGFRQYVELGWGERVTVDGVIIEAIPVNHWGKRFPWGRNRGYNGYIFSRNDLRVLFASDTAYISELSGRRSSDNQLDVAIIGNGAYDPWIGSHANPEQVWQMFIESGAQYLVPVHWGTFRLGKEPYGDAMRRLTAAAGPSASRIVIDTIGGEWVLPAKHTVAAVEGVDRQQSTVPRSTVQN